MERDRRQDEDKQKQSSKLRRNRKFAQQGTIESQLPHSRAPQSRKYSLSSPQSVPYGVLDGDRTDLSLLNVVNNVICGDSVSVLKQLPDDWCACAITSPPYWNTVDYGIEKQIGVGSYELYLDELDCVWEQVDRVLIPNGKFCLNVPLLPLSKEVSEKEFGQSHTRMLLDLYSDMKRRVESKTSLQLFSLYIWEKQTTEKMFGSYPYPPNLYERNYIEFIAVFVKPGSPRTIPPEVKNHSKLTQQDWMDLTQQIWWMYPENIARLEGHPAPFPEALPNRLIAMYTFKSVPEENFVGDIVLDPLSGSGTTCVAAKRLQRRYVGIDLNPEFCRFAIERLAMTHESTKLMSAIRPDLRPESQISLGIENSDG
jgi:modification methylase